VAAGVATTHFGLHQTAVVYSAALAVLAAAAAGSLIIRTRSRPGSPSGPPEALRASRPALWKGPPASITTRPPPSQPPPPRPPQPDNKKSRQQLDN
jgi:hypothetical protein